MERDDVFRKGREGPVEDASELKERRRRVLAKPADAKRTGKSDKAIRNLNRELRTINDALGPKERRARQTDWKDPKEYKRERQRKLEQLYKRRRLPQVPQMREVVFPIGRKVHLAPVSKASGRIEFTLCGERVSAEAHAYSMTDTPHIRS
jgi:hypothetical protein